MASIAGHLAEYRALRREVETSTLALATSVDGRRFTCQAAPGPLALGAGGYVEMEGTGGHWLGQLMSLEIEHADAGQVGWSGDTALSSPLRTRFARGAGAVLTGPPQPFHDAAIRPAG